MKLLRFPMFALAILSALSGCGPKKSELRICVWENYIDPVVVKNFAREYGCRVLVDNFPDNEMLYAKMKSGEAKYDLLMPSSYMTEVMHEEGMIIDLDQTLLPNSKYVDKAYLKKQSLDNALKYSMPYMLCNTVVAYDSEIVKDPEHTWGIFGNPEYKKRICVISDLREFVGAALKVNGFSVNTTNDEELAQAEKNNARVGRKRSEA